MSSPTHLRRHHLPWPPSLIFSTCIVPGIVPEVLKFFYEESLESFLPICQTQKSQNFLPAITHLAATPLHLTGSFIPFHSSSVHSYLSRSLELVHPDPQLRLGNCVIMTSSGAEFWASTHFFRSRTSKRSLLWAMHSPWHGLFLGVQFLPFCKTTNSVHEDTHHLLWPYVSGDPLDSGTDLSPISEVGIHSPTGPGKSSDSTQGHEDTYQWSPALTAPTSPDRWSIDHRFCMTFAAVLEKNIREKMFTL